MLFLYVGTVSTSRTQTNFVDIFFLVSGIKKMTSNNQIVSELRVLQFNPCGYLDMLFFDSEELI